MGADTKCISCAVSEQCGLELLCAGCRMALRAVEPVHDIPVQVFGNPRFRSLCRSVVIHEDGHRQVEWFVRLTLDGEWLHETPHQNTAAEACAKAMTLMSPPSTDEIPE